MGVLQIGISAMVIENKVKTLTITTFLFQPSKSSVPLHSGTKRCLLPTTYSHVLRPLTLLIPSNSDINDAIPPPQVIIALPVVLPPSPVLSLSPMFDSQDFFPSEEISSPKNTETPIKSPIPVSLSSSVGSSTLVRSTTPPPNYPLISYLSGRGMKPLGSEPVPEESNVHYWK
ncbi:hypothetical protein Tco_0986647 [Tanacetum coccineum]